MIRAATAADAPAITAFWNPQIRDTLVTFNSIEKTDEEVATMIATRRAFFVVEEGGVIGFATYDQFRGGVGYARTMEHTVILAPDAQGRGWGRALMQTLEDHARANGVHSMIAGVSGGNENGCAFHAALGYARVGTVAQAGHKFDQYWDLVLMQKVL